MSKYCECGNSKLETRSACDRCLTLERSRLTDNSTQAGGKRSDSERIDDMTKLDNYLREKEPWNYPESE